jgi:hypothetical protein
LQHGYKFLHSPPNRQLFFPVEKNKEKKAGSEKEALALCGHGNGTTLSSSSPLLISRQFYTPETH